MRKHLVKYVLLSVTALNLLLASPWVAKASPCTCPDGCTGDCCSGTPCACYSIGTDSCKAAEE